MKTTSDALIRRLKQLGYADPAVEKIDGHWTVTAVDPLNNVQVKLDNLGRSVETALTALATLPKVPDHYVCAHARACAECGSIDRPLGYTEIETGNFIQCCRSCGHKWVALTAAEQLEGAEARMTEAVEVINPVLRAFLKGKLR